MTLDGLTIVGYCSKYTLHDLEYNPFIEKVWITPKNIYHYNMQCIGGAFIQLKHESEWQPVFPEKNDHITNTAKPMRLEFNPNNYKGSSEKYLINIIKKMHDTHFTRKDIAIDLFDIDMNDFLILDKRKRRQTLMRQSNGTLETLYMGARESNEQIRIYDKAKERKIKKKKWWRIEAQLRGDIANVNYYNPYESVVISKKSTFQDLEIKERALLLYLQSHPEAIRELSKASRTKYKKLLLRKADTFEIDLSQIYFEGMHDIVTEINSWMTFTEEKLNIIDPMKPLHYKKRIENEQEEDYYKKFSKNMMTKGD